MSYGSGRLFEFFYLHNIYSWKFIYIFWYPYYICVQEVFVFIFLLVYTCIWENLHYIFRFLTSIFIYFSNEVLNWRMFCSWSITGTYMVYFCCNTFQIWWNKKFWTTTNQVWILSTSQSIIQNSQFSTEFRHNYTNLQTKLYCRFLHIFIQVVIRSRQKYEKMKK